MWWSIKAAEYCEINVTGNVIVLTYIYPRGKSCPDGPAGRKESTLQVCLFKDFLYVHRFLKEIKYDRKTLK
jgi:hypothetical protein